MFALDSCDFTQERLMEHSSQYSRPAKRKHFDPDYVCSSSTDTRQFKKRRPNAAGRERARLKQFNEALCELQNAIPIRLTQNRKLHKKQTLKLAVRYIDFLQGCLNGDRKWSERQRFWCQGEDKELMNAMDEAEKSQTQLAPQCESPCTQAEPYVGPVPPTSGYIPSNYCEQREFEEIQPSCFATHDPQDPVNTVSQAFHSGETLHYQSCAPSSYAIEPYPVVPFQTQSATVFDPSHCVQTPESQANFPHDCLSPNNSFLGLLAPSDLIPHPESPESGIFSTSSCEV